MRKLIPVAIVGALGYFAYGKYRDSVAEQQRLAAEDARAEQVEVAPAEAQVEYSTPPPRLSERRCDGRVYCSQMTSCEEATWFLQNCPGVKMDRERDGSSDGVPCESQWCGQR